VSLIAMVTANEQLLSWKQQKQYVGYSAESVCMTTVLGDTRDKTRWKKLNIPKLLEYNEGFLAYRVCA
jgi:hypothetical protein